MVSNIECMAEICNGDGDFEDIRFNDINGAMDYLHAALPEQMSLEDRCKRYAALTYFLPPRGQPQPITVLRACKLSAEEIDQVYRRLELRDELAVLYMTVIDGYRAASHLGPPFLELIECLRRVDRPYVEAFLNQPELVTIAYLHKRILESPDTMIDLDSIDQQHFTVAFRTSLENIFKNNLISETQTTQDREQGNRTDSSHLYPNIGGERKAHRRRRELVTSHRHREQERLRKRRLHILQPNVVQAKTRERQRRFRDRHRIKDAQRQLGILDDWTAHSHQSYVASSSEPSHQQQFRTSHSPERNHGCRLHLFTNRSVRR